MDFIYLFIYFFFYIIITCKVVYTGNGLLCRHNDRWRVQKIERIKGTYKGSVYWWRWVSEITRSILCRSANPRKQRKFKPLENVTLYGNAPCPTYTVSALITLQCNVTPQKLLPLYIHTLTQCNVTPQKLLPLYIHTLIQCSVHPQKLLPLYIHTLTCPISLRTSASHC